MISPSSRRSRSVGWWQYEALPPISMPPTGRRPSCSTTPSTWVGPPAMADADVLGDADCVPGCTSGSERGNHDQASGGRRRSGCVDRESGDSRKVGWDASDSDSEATS